MEITFLFLRSAATSFLLDREEPRMATAHKEKFQPVGDEKFPGPHERITRTAKHQFWNKYTTLTFHSKQMNTGFCVINVHCSDDPAVDGMCFIYPDGFGVQLEV